MKRGQAQQFNWIFIMIVGIIILLFFLGFLVKYLDLQESKENAEIARGFSNSILSMKGTEQYKNSSFDFPFGVIYDCENIIVNEEMRFKMPYTISMDEFNSDELVYWVKEYRKGFLVDRVVFISDKKTKYYFDESFVDGIPPKVKNLLLTSSLQEADVIVSSSLTGEGKKNVLVQSGNIDINGTSFSYDGSDFFVYAAAFSSPEVFECTQRKLSERFNELKEIYRLRIQQISMYQNVFCNYNSISNAIASGDVNGMVSLNNELANLDCEVVF
jgi:hypothetical protein